MRNFYLFHVTRKIIKIFNILAKIFHNKMPEIILKLKERRKKNNKFYADYIDFIYSHCCLVRDAQE